MQQTQIKPGETAQPTSRKKSRRGPKFYFHLDEPTIWDPKIRWVRTSGWCVESKGTPLLSIRARLRGRIFHGRFDRERPDVLEHVHKPHAPLLCGFTLPLFLPAGPTRLVFEVTGPDNQWREVFTRRVWGSLSPQAGQRQWCEADANELYNFWFDLPNDWSKKARQLHICGWCFTREAPAITEIRARIGRKIFPASYGLPRPDVAVTTENPTGALRSGFALDATFPPGFSTITFEAQRGGKEWEAFYAQCVRGPFFWKRWQESNEAIGNYSFWIRRYEQLTQGDRKQIQGHIAQFGQAPRFSVLTPVYNTDLIWLRKAIASVQQQLYPHWELCVVDDASTDPRVWPFLQKQARVDSRIKVSRRSQRGHIAAASNDALSLATGDFIALLDHDDELAPTALYFNAVELNRRPDLQLLYSDEDKIDEKGHRRDPYFKPDWNPDLFTSQNYIAHLCVYRTDLVRKLGDFREGFEGSQDYDLTLRCVEQLDSALIHHIPRVLYHWRSVAQSTAQIATAKPYAHTAAIRAMQEHFTRIEVAASVLTHGNYLRVRYPLPPDPPLVSMIIPTRDQAFLLQKCLESIFAKTDYSNFEVIVLDNGSSERATFDYFHSLGTNDRVRVHCVEGAFNYSRLNNIGADLARGALLAFLNNDLEVINSDWLSEMAGHALRAEVGAVGARLWYPDKTIQHGGVILGAGGIAGHTQPAVGDNDVSFGRAHLTQNFSAVTAACMVVPKNLYIDLGGLDEVNLPIAFNDVDFCLRLREKGLRIVWTPHAEFYHHESASRGFEDTMNKQQRFLAEVAYMQQKWKSAITADPCYNPNLALNDDLFTLAFPPRISKPWQAT